MFCTKCGKEIPDGSVFCQFCGQQIGATVQSQQVVYVAPEKQPKSQFIAILLCLFLGLIGIHDFYLNRYNYGFYKLIIIILLGWIGIGFIINIIWCFVDLISISNKYYDCFYYEKENINDKNKELSEKKINLKPLKILILISILSIFMMLFIMPMIIK